tara:strand:- start:113 stop:292 length:180 start_codon:yes stop_codon:yes gene_type:complete
LGGYADGNETRFVRSLRAFVTTDTLLKLIAAAATIGLMCQLEPNTGTRMPAASGILSAL